MTVTTPPNRDLPEFHLITKEHSDVLELRGFGPQHQTHTPGTILITNITPFHKCFSANNEPEGKSNEQLVRS